MDNCKQCSCHCHCHCHCYCYCDNIVETTDKPKPLPKNTFVYVNENISINSVKAYSVNSSNVVTLIDTYLTNGTGGAGTFYISEGAKIVAKKYLYVINTVSNDVSGFNINQSTGVLTSMVGSPFATNSLSGNSMSLAASPNGKFLYVMNQQSNTFSVFGINSLTGVLTLNETFLNPYGTSVNQIHVTPNNKFLIATIGDISRQIATYTINQITGKLTAKSSINTISKNSGAPAALDITSNGKFVYVGIAQDFPSNSIIVDIYSINVNGVLTAVTAYVEQVGGDYTGDSAIVLLSPDNKFLFIGNIYNVSIATLRVKSNNTLAKLHSTFIPGSTPTLIETNAAGTMMYNIDIGTGTLGQFTIGANGLVTFVQSIFVGQSLLKGLAVLSF